LSGKVADQIDDLIDKANQLGDAGDKDGALAKYFEALALDVNNPTVLYNIGLNFKYRGAWQDSFKYNRRASEIRGGDEATEWNLAIAATALRDWKTARATWKGLGMKIDGEGPIFDNFGSTPVRLNPEGEGEVVWGSRLCPVRARIDNIPYPESGFAYGDVVLHDGAPVGYRLDAAGLERPVFNVLEMYEQGDFTTYLLDVVADSVQQIDAFGKLCDARGMQFEDWNRSVRQICRECSEGKPHDHGDHTWIEPEWKPERQVAVSARKEADVGAVIEAWDGKVTEWGYALER
jgi:tetratricopeptide (TPR) repeat protein